MMSEPVHGYATTHHRPRGRDSQQEWACEVRSWLIATEEYNDLLWRRVLERDRNHTLFDLWNRTPQSIGLSHRPRNDARPREDHEQQAHDQSHGSQHDQTRIADL